MSSKAINFTTHEVIAWRSLTRGVLFHPLEPQPAYHKRRRLSWDWSPPRSKDSPERSCKWHGVPSVTCQHCDFFAQNCPLGRPGDFLRVREPYCRCKRDGFRYEADLSATEYVGLRRYGAGSMPISYSRLTLQIMEITVMQIQSLTFDDWRVSFAPNCEEQRAALVAFTGQENQRFFARRVWDGKYGNTHPWDRNPWVFRLAVSRCR